MVSSNPNLVLLPQPTPQEIADKLISLANHDGGTIVAGYDKLGHLTTRLSPEELEALLREAVALTSPLVPASLETSDNAKGGPSHMIVVSASKVRHQLASEAREVSRSTPVPESYEDQSVPGATQADFEPTIVEEYFIKRAARERKQADVFDRSAILREIGAVNSAGQPTAMGILLFGKTPGMFIKSSGVTFVKYPGVDMRADGGAMGYSRREEISGPLARVVERTWDVVFEEMRVGAVVKGRTREDVLEYPELAVREALVNAISHRDYGIAGRRIEIRKFSDRLEIISPGGLAGYMTLENLVEEHYSRNPGIVHGLYQWGYIEELGLGIDRMIEEMQSAGHPDPKFDSTFYSFKVTLSNFHDRRTNQHFTPAASLAPTNVQLANVSVTERQARAMTYVRDYGRITNSDYGTLCPSVSAETLRSDLADLVSKGVLMRVGEKKGTYYISK